MNCPRCGTPMSGGVCPECGFPVTGIKVMKSSNIHSIIQLSLLREPNHCNWL